MCGILGAVYGPEGPPAGEPTPTSGAKAMFPDIKHRGRDSFGWLHHGLNSKGYSARKYPMEATYSNMKYLRIPRDVHYWLGHVRLATHGTHLYPGNNHPVLHKDWAVVHNGVVRNYAEILKKTGRRDELVEVDTEAIPAAVHRYGIWTGLKAIEGAAAVALANRKDPTKVILARQGSPLWVATSQGGATYFASESMVLKVLETRFKIKWADAPWYVDEYHLLEVEHGLVTRYEKYREPPPEPKVSTWAERQALGRGSRHFHSGGDARFRDGEGLTADEWDYLAWQAQHGIRRSNSSKGSGPKKSTAGDGHKSASSRTTSSGGTKPASGSEPKAADKAVPGVHREVEPIESLIGDLMEDGGMRYSTAAHDSMYKNHGKVLKYLDGGIIITQDEYEKYVLAHCPECGTATKSDMSGVYCPSSMCGWWDWASTIGWG